MNNRKKIGIIKNKVLTRIIIFLGGKMISLILAAGKVKSCTRSKWSSDGKNGFKIIEKRRN